MNRVAHMPEKQSRNRNILKSINPATGELVKEYEAMSAQEAHAVIDAAHIAFTDWRDTDFETRAGLMSKMAGLLEDKKEELATLMSTEMGKVRKEAVSEIEKCAWVCDYYAEHAQEFLADEEVDTSMAQSLVTYQPIGVVLAVMPWNFPFWQVFRFAAPSLMAGNAGALKHASSVSGCALAIEDLFKEAGFPENLFRTALVGSDKVGDLIENPHLRAVTLTGSTAAGRSVAAKAGECLKKTVLELGGSDPYVVLEDADIKKAAATCTKSRLINAGQSCIAAKRFIVVKEVYDEFIKALENEMGAKTTGMPDDKDADIGPLSSEGLRDDLHKQVTKSIDQGAKCILGGKVPDKKGAWYPPTILIDITEGMTAYEEELFGPVASVIKAQDMEDAIAIANDSPYGLGGAVFTEDIEKGRDIARRKINSGAVTVNDFVKSDPRMPFGGVKDSGYGRELSWFGIREFVNIKAVNIA